MTNATATKPKPTVIGATIDRMFELREAKRILEAQVSKLDDEFAELEEQLMAKLDAEGTTKGAGKKAAASISESVVGNVTDWDKFYAYMSKNKLYYLLHRRLSDAGIRQFFEQGKKVPGVEPFTKRKLNLRVSAS